MEFRLFPQQPQQQLTKLINFFVIPVLFTDYDQKPQLFANESLHCPQSLHNSEIAPAFSDRIGRKSSQK